MGNISGEMKMVRNNARNRKYCNIKNAFDVIISRLDMAEERIGELEDMSIETSQTEE